MEVDIVIARYNENIAWIDTLPSASKIWIYNKGKEELKTNKPNIFITKLPNIGRESHTYITHIVNNYHNIAPGGVTVFCQGKIYDHIPRELNESTFVQMLVRDASENGFSQNQAKWHDIPKAHQPLENFRIHEWPPGTPNSPNKCNESFGMWFRRCTKMPYLPPRHEFKWVMSANFAVKNSVILTKPKEYYISLQSEFDDSAAPEVGHFFERSWYYIF